MSDKTSCFPPVKPSEEIRISEGSTVELHFSVAIEDGAEIDNTRGHAYPVVLTIGDGNLLEGFEKALLGLRTGDRRTVHLPPEEAFGIHNVENVQKFDRMLWVKVEEDPETGMVIEFSDKGGATLAGVVVDVTEDQVTVDFNHPLAGKNIIFEVEIFRVTPPGHQGVELK